MHGFIVAICIFPLVFMAVSASTSENYLLAFLITFVVYTMAFILFVRDMNRRQDEYTIIADEQGVTFLKKGSFKWEEVVSISPYTQMASMGRTRHEEKYIRFKLVGDSEFSIEVTNCDHELYEIADKLKKLSAKF